MTARLVCEEIAIATVAAMTATMIIITTNSISEKPAAGRVLESMRVAIPWQRAAQVQGGALLEEVPALLTGA
jgi:hypothetical protein